MKESMRYVNLHSAPCYNHGYTSIGDGDGAMYFRAKANDWIWFFCDGVVDDRGNYLFFEYPLKPHRYIMDYASDEFPEFDHEPDESVVATRVVVLAACLIISMLLTILLFTV